MRKTLLVVGVVVLCTLVLACSLGVEAAKGTSRVHSKDAKLKRAAQVSSIASRKSFFKRDVCPGGGNCNNHGLCNTDNTCSCVNGYAGVDCSILDSEAQFGKLYSGSVARQQWSFYHIDISPDLPAFSVNANQTSDEGDCDLYIQKGSYPSKSSFYEKDNTLSNEMTIAVANPESATWYAGIYGFQACQYSFRINSNAVACSCSGHGVCFGSATNCTCENTYYGNQCQYQLKELKPNVVLTDSITVRTWRYYTFAATKKNNVYFNITEIGNGDSDLYIKYGKYPTFTDYDAKDISLQSNYQVLLNNVQVGTYYVGMYGYTNSSYSILTTISTECGNLCSNHGTCNGDTCTCSSGFSGSVCENYVPALALGQPVAGFVYPGVWNYFHYTANSEDSLKVTTYQTDKTGDCDLFVRAGQNPNRFNYDYLDVSFAVNTSITIPNPGSQTWYIGVLGYRTCTFSVAVQVVAKPKDCDPACVNGQCSAGVCVCNSGYAGATCASSLSPISIAVATSGTVTPNGWVYYSISQSSSTFVNIFVNEPNSPAGLLEVYISDDGAIPDRTNYAAKGSLSGSTTTIALSRDGRTYDYIIGIYGTLNGNGQSIQYNVVAHQTSF